MKSVQICLALILSCVMGCGQNNGLITDGEDQALGRRPPPTRSSSGSSSTATTTTQTNGTVNFADGEVTRSIVWLEREAFMISGELKPAIRVVTSLAPTKGTLFILLRLSRWARAEDIAPIKFDDIVVTIRQHDTTSLWHFPDLWPGTTDMVSIMPLETLEQQALPRATAELHTITREHEFVPYELVEEHRHLVFPPP